MGDQLHQAVAFGGGVLGMTAHVEIQARTVTQEDVGAAAPGHHTAKQVAGHLVRGQPTVTVKCAGDTELGFDAHDSTLHVFEGTGCWLAAAR
ncbi:Uncharacterised protein [Mycobacterium tuberculosis]|nr:Uncharacterised protein [Mycobacterium tuberculosis]CNM29072.1 Uncharacterised protein [Mycobacterium tuberculosis]CNM33393.1 Uncharacterised protein [Mycobacterium tuberculosis]COY06725.1 Uncharacterised protein [Mycobacterium tuberculosis]COZ81884.1 Uncharacterised protein [Mycobacterium tuberculosis]